MDDPTRDPARTTAVAVARELAELHPAAKLPCPLCGTTLRADNLDKHLAKTHQTAPTSPPTTSVLRFRGADRRSIRPLLTLAILCALALAVVQTILAVPFGAPQIVLLAALWLSLGAIALTYFGKLPASLTLDGDKLHLRYCLGLFGTSLRLPATLEVGTLIQFRQDLTVPDEVHAIGRDEPTGHYLRLSDARVAVTIACTHKSGFGSHWTGWRPGPRRRAWDITLARESQVALEYALAARGMLSPKPDGG